MMSSDFTVNILFSFNIKIIYTLLVQQLPQIITQYVDCIGPVAI
ncbi:protein of unknown function [Legionella fallonii LLAP-10]|uniref:Uncharacterized protein n=1 Tax=Legionella fallonii LLAP-10 TaxID=1212491 RepID=A0A098G3M7_9GAMM|nr:protein of unknown function [Legionella fallonii LLAP-10]